MPKKFMRKPIGMVIRNRKTIKDGVITVSESKKKKLHKYTNHHCGENYLNEFNYDITEATYLFIQLVSRMQCALCAILGSYVKWHFIFMYFFCANFEWIGSVHEPKKLLQSNICRFEKNRKKSIGDGHSTLRYTYMKYSEDACAYSYIANLSHEYSFDIQTTFFFSTHSHSN